MATIADNIRLSNPDGVHPPLAAYTHGIVVPPGARTLYIAGQVGLRPDGSIAGDLSAQADQVYRNLGVILTANDFTFGDIIRLTTYIVAGQAGSVVMAVRGNYLGAHRPAATAVYVPRLFAPQWLVEIEAIAAKV